jgi:hypothetical protein
VVETAPSSVSGFRAPGGRGLASTFSLAGLVSAGNSDIQGQIVGEFTDDAGIQHGFLEAGGHFTSISPPGDTFTKLFGINNLGQVLGATSSIANFVYAHGRFTPLSDLGDSAFSLGINDLGQIVGGVSVSNGDTIGLLDTRGHITTYAAPGHSLCWHYSGSCTSHGAPQCVTGPTAQPHQIVGGCRKREGPSDAFAAAELGSLLAGDSLDPAESFLNPFADALAHVSEWRLSDMRSSLLFNGRVLCLWPDLAEEHGHHRIDLDLQHVGAHCLEPLFDGPLQLVRLRNIVAVTSISLRK